MCYFDLNHFLAKVDLFITQLTLASLGLKAQANELPRKVVG